MYVTVKLSNCWLWIITSSYIELPRNSSKCDKFHVIITFTGNYE
jgi:hypothetical protein